MTVNSENLVFVIHRTHDALRSCEDQIYGEQGLTTERYEVLTAIKYLDKPVRVTDIARRLTRSINSISMIIDRMIKVDLVKRVRDKRDRRSVHLSITSKGETLLKPATLVGQEFTQKILSQLSYEDRQALLGLLLTVQQASDNEQAPEQPLLLTDTQRGILEMVARGCRNSEIAEALSIPPKKASNYVSDLLVRLHAKNRAHAVTIAVRKGIIGGGVKLKA